MDSVPLSECPTDHPTAASNPPPQSLQIRPIEAEEHLSFVETCSASTSFLQCPSWAAVKSGWSSQSLGWFDRRHRLVGTALVLYRSSPRWGRSFAYIPEGPLINWGDPDLFRWLNPLVDHLRARGVFAVKMGPPLPLREWHADTLKRAIADPSARQLRDVPPDRIMPAGSNLAETLAAHGWVRCGLPITGRGDVQPRHVFEVPLDRRIDDVWEGFNQQWRRSVRKAEKAGVSVTRGTYDDLPEFFDLLQVTQRRDGFDLGRSLAYYRRQYRALTTENPDRMRLYLARYQGELVAAHTLNVVGRRAWYHLGASADSHRDVGASHAVQWRMMSDAHALRCTMYDMRGFPDSLDSNDRASGLLQWKLGTGGRAVEYLGEWDYPINRPLYGAFRAYLRWRRRT